MRLTPWLLSFGLVLLPFLAQGVSAATSGQCLGAEDQGSCTGVHDTCPTACPVPQHFYCVGIYDYATGSCTGIHCSTNPAGTCGARDLSVRRAQAPTTSVFSATLNRFVAFLK